MAWFWLLISGKLNCFVSCYGVIESRTWFAFVRKIIRFFSASYSIILCNRVVVLCSLCTFTGLSIRISVIIVFDSISKDCYFNFYQFKVEVGGVYEFKLLPQTFRREDMAIYVRLCEFIKLEMYLCLSIFGSMLALFWLGNMDHRKYKLCSISFFTKMEDSILKEGWYIFPFKCLSYRMFYRTF